MKRKFTTCLMGLSMSTAMLAQTLVTGPSTTVAPYVLPLLPGYTVTSVKTAPETIGNYTMTGIPDGVGAYDNNDGTFTLLMNHEISVPGGVVRAHGSNGAFISKWTINKSTLAVSSVSDLIQNVKLWTGTTYTTYNATNPSTLAAFSRFCSADLPAATAYYNKVTGRGTQERVFMNGEETGTEGRIFAHVATGTNAGTSYELPLLGKYSCENVCANPRRSDKTIVIGMDDATPGQVYVYVGNKGTSGSEIDKAGLTNGLLYGVAVAGMVTETSTLVPAPNTTFSLINVNASINLLTATGASLNTVSNTLGITNFLRPEDGCWDPSRPTDFYFNTTNAFNAPSRVWRLRFNDIDNPQLGGTITAVLDGTEGQQMLDNMTIDNSGHILLQEDVGNNAWLGRILSYDIASDVLTPILQHDANLFITGGTGFLTQDEETSGIIDVQAILGPGKFIFVDQAHYTISGPAYEGGQLLVLNSANTASSNPEINVLGNSVNINMGNTSTSSTDNTDFGMINAGTFVTKTFVIQNTGTGALVISNMDFTGPNAGDFTFVNPPSYPASIAAGASLTITAKYSPVLQGTSNATLSIYNNDFNENIYDYAVKGISAMPEIDINGNNVGIVAGSTVTSSSNNTDFGNAIVNTSITKSFILQNTGNGTLTISGFSVSGVNAADFTLLNPPTVPVSLAGAGSQTLSVKFMPGALGLRNAKISVYSNDADESVYDFAVSGNGLLDVGVGSHSKNNGTFVLYPNPANELVDVKLNVDVAENITLSVIDISGKKVLNLEEEVTVNSGLTLNTKELINGVYFVQLSSGKTISTIKLVVIH